MYRLVKGNRTTLVADTIAIGIYALALCILTYPLVFRLGDIIPFHNPDTYTAMWQNWWLQTALTQGLDPHYTNYLFFPSGLDITIIPQRWTSYPLWAVYDALFDEPVAYNLTVLTQTVIRAYAMFRLILLFVPHRTSAWIGGAFFAFVPRMLAGGIQQPNTGAVEFIPIFMIFFVLALRQLHQNPQQRRQILLLMTLAGIAFSANVYMNIKIGIFAMLLGGVYIAWRFVADRLWNHHNFWIASIYFGIITSAMCAPLLIPTISFGGLGEAIDQFVPGGGIDILAFVKADLEHSFFYNYFFAANDGVELTQRLPNAFSQIGFVSILINLIGMVVVVRKFPRQHVWIVVLLLAFWLSLGTVLRIDRVAYEQIPMLMSALQYNPIFQALRDPFRFQILMIFAMSIFVAHGIHWLWGRLPRRLSPVVIILLTGLMLFEISVFPIPYRDAQVSEAYDYVTERHTGSIISMPMGRQPAKYMMYNQIHHNQPIVEGMIARMPEDAYDTFDSFLLLRDMGDMHDISQVRDDLFDNWDAEIQRLLDSGFRYVVVHRLEDTGRWLVVTHPYQEFMFFMEIEPDFETESAAVYDLEKLIGNPPTGDALELERTFLDEMKN